MKVVLAALVAAFAVTSAVQAAGKSDPEAGFDFYSSASIYQSPPLNLLVSTEQDPPVSAVNTDWSATDDDGPVIVGQGDAIICLDEDGEDQTCHAFMTWAEAEEYAQSNQDAGVYPLLGGSIMPLVIDDPLWYIHTLALIERSAHFDTTDPYAPPAPPTPMIASATGN